MKKILAIAIILFGVFMSYVVIGGFIQKQQKENVPTSSVVKAPVSTTTATATYTIAEVAGHNTQSDCWLIINNKVYDVASFLGEHPGGASTIIPYCGKEATRAFDTQDRGAGGGHSPQASEMLSDYLIGSIK